MSQQKQSDVVWLNTSPSLSWLSQPLLNKLSHHITISKWEYIQRPDEASSLNVAIQMLDNYLQSSRQSVHLIGHSIGGLVGLLYTHKYPEKVKSLTLLAVGADAALDWQAHYYMHLPSA
ncbi:MAG: alpha/beta fold hydrolase [Nostoc sp.]